MSAAETQTNGAPGTVPADTAPGARGKALVVLSGGLDSTVLLAKLLDAGRECHALSVHYGQRHFRELDAARAVCTHYGVPHQIADLRALLPLWGANSLTTPAQAVPDGHYTDASMKATVVPGRNLVLLSVATAAALAAGCATLAYGAHGGDHAIYPDCRPEFADALAAAIALADWKPLVLERPFIHLDKAGIVRLGSKLGVPFGLTWSCYKGGDLHCGRCATCTERREAFRLAGVPDPTCYAD
ncbi:MAG: 7-cyano-7-deazaguanine synthase QueC [Puniceicoccales bacterium]|jgi:7-cyano-7-deazaguanine synthase|nr:7-cyano-7-deazaguanine synthase QueC [Puniceicoccales bacterium]